MDILLVHGLGRTPLSMFGLAPALRRAGHHTLFFGYSPTLESVSRIVDRLTRRLRALARRRRPVGLVGHSLGGLLLRMALPRVPELLVHRLVMLGTPNRPPRLARRASLWPPFRWLTRDCGRFLACTEYAPELPPPADPYTLIAGTAGPRGRWSPFGDEPNDGIVAVPEVPIRETDLLLLFPMWHTFMMNDANIQAAIVQVMK